MTATSRVVGQPLLAAAAFQLLVAGGWAG